MRHNAKPLQWSPLLHNLFPWYASHSLSIWPPPKMVKHNYKCHRQQSPQTYWNPQPSINVVWKCSIEMIMASMITYRYVKFSKFTKCVLSWKSFNNKMLELNWKQIPWRSKLLTNSSLFPLYFMHVSLKNKQVRKCTQCSNSDAFAVLLPLDF
jgi:hypothetical protein